jgi:predicted Zn-dependent protease with MMP-like domain
MTRQEFRAHVDQALAMIPDRFREAMQNIAIVVEDEPSPQMLREMDLEPPDTLLGLYQGTPLTERQWSHGNALPDKITLYQGPIEDASSDNDDVVVAIAETLIHEIGHYFGLSEEEIEDIEENYWNGGDEENEENEEDDDPSPSS